MRGEQNVTKKEEQRIVRYMTDENSKIRIEVKDVRTGTNRKLHEVVDISDMVKQARIGEEEATDSLSLLQ